MKTLIVFNSIENPKFPIKLPGYQSVSFKYQNTNLNECPLINNYYKIKNFHKFVPKRKIEFLAGRYCAHKAIEELGYNFNDIIDIQENRCPKWPKALTGSITHTKNFASAVVISQSKIKSIGIDSENIIPESQADQLKDSILTKNELQNFKDKFKLNLLCTIFFSAKESIFKCLYPLIAKMFSMQDIEIFYFSLLENIFKFRLLVNLDHEFTKNYEGYGNIVIDDNYVHTLFQLI